MIQALPRQGQSGTHLWAEVLGIAVLTLGPTLVACSSTDGAEGAGSAASSGQSTEGTSAGAASGGAGATSGATTGAGTGSSGASSAGSPTTGGQSGSTTGGRGNTTGEDASAPPPEGGSGGTSGTRTTTGGSGGRDASADRELFDARADATSAADVKADANGAGDGATSGVLAGAPPMGWNSWNTFGCNVSETLVKGMADAMVSSGMQAAGYEFINIDDCWMDGRDGSGNLRWNASRFPSGIPSLAEYIHGKGLKLGIYETPANLTCAGLYGPYSQASGVGSLGHEAQDARTFASWGIDYLKYDLCQGQRSSFAVMRDALRATGRPIVYSINPGNGGNDLCPPNPNPPDGSKCGLNLPSIANLWRIGFDINASWSSVIGLVDQDAQIARYAGPGHWNDPDMLEVGNGSLTADENRAHFSMWAILAAPLIAGNDLRSMSSAVKTILTNTEVIAVNQDPLGAQGALAATPQNGLQVWSKPLSGGARAVALLNRNGSAASITVTFTQIGLPNGQASVRDLWQHTDLGTFNGSYTASNVPSHGVVMLRIASSP